MPNPCIFCGAPWERVEDEIDHKSDCAQVTGLYPVLDQDLGAKLECVNCHHINRWPGGFGCCICGHRFVIGDFYTLRDLGPHQTAVVCLGCEALERPFPEDVPSV